MQPSSRDFKFFFKREFFTSILKYAYNLKANVEMCNYLCWEDNYKSDYILSVCWDNLADPLACGHYIFEVVDSILSLDDSMAKWRVAVALDQERGLLHTLKVFQDREKRRKDTPININLSHTANYYQILVFYDFLWKMILKNTKVAGWIRHIRDYFFREVNSFFEDIIQSLQYRIKYSTPSVEDQSQLNQSTHLYEKLKEFLEDKANIPFEDYSQFNPV